MHYYTTNSGNIDHWHPRGICGYVFDLRTDPGAHFPGLNTEVVVDMFSNQLDSMHFWCTRSSGHMALQSSGYWNTPVDVFKAPVVKTPDTVPMWRFWNQERNTHIFTTLDPESALYYIGYGYTQMDVVFYLFNYRNGPKPGLVPLNAWLHGTP